MKNDSPMIISSDGRDHLTRLEGARRHMYLDEAGLPTIGVGHLLTRSELTSGKIIIDGKAVHWKNGLNDHYIDRLLDQDLDRFEKAVNDYVTVPLVQHQFDALVTFSFNVGRTAFRNSTLLRLLNEGLYGDVPDQMRRWIYTGGKKSNGLVKRREMNIAFWQGVYA